jgi:hypothetical protein
LASNRRYVSRRNVRICYRDRLFTLIGVACLPPLKPWNVSSIHRQGGCPEINQCRFEEKASVTSPVEKIRRLLNLPLIFSKCPALFYSRSRPTPAWRPTRNADSMLCTDCIPYRIKYQYITWFPIPVLCPSPPLAFRRCPIPTSSLANKAISPPPRGLASQSGDLNYSTRVRGDERPFLGSNLTLSLLFKAWVCCLVEN